MPFVQYLGRVAGIKIRIYLIEKIIFSGNIESMAK